MNILASELQDWLHQRQQKQSHRQLLVVSGSQDYCRSVFNLLASEYPDTATALLGRALFPDHQAGELKYYRRLLGSECSLAVYDAFDALRPNAVLALAGTVVRGGLMILCCPPLSKWPAYQEQTTGHYLSYGETCETSSLRHYLATEFTRCKRIALCEEESNNYLPFAPVNKSPQTKVGIQPPFATGDQQSAFNHIAGKLPDLDCAVITAHRGRGKSTLMGMLAGQSLLNNTPVLIASRHASGADMVFKGLTLTCPDAQYIEGYHYSYNGTTCKWVPLDHPDLNSLQDHLLIIDEAAATPIPQLTQLCTNATKLLLSTTMIGYEGSGRGFITRFMPWLQRRFPALTHCSLHEPVRWYTGDQLELFWHDAFALNTSEQSFEKTEDLYSHSESSSVAINTINKHALITEHSENVLNLLMQAHYQTTTDELVRLTDSPNHHTLVARCEGEIIGVLTYQLEGGEHLQPVASDIARGARRVNGHLSAQALALLIAKPDLATFRYWRINRIAVSRAYRRRGIGTQLIKALKSHALTAGIDGLTTSFGATEDLISFWQQQQFIEAKPGLKKDASSGEYSLLMMMPLSPQLCEHGQLIRYRFKQEFSLHPAPQTFMQCNLIKQCKTALTDACNKRMLSALTQHHRSLQHTNAAICWLINKVALSSLSASQQTSYHVLKHYIDTLHSPGKFMSEHPLQGKRSIEDYVVKHLQILYDAATG